MLFDRERMCKAGAEDGDAGMYRAGISEALIQGLLPRPSELEVYLGDAGIYYRPIGEAQPVGAGAPAEPVADIALYTF